ncbi:flagellin [Thiogranum longum]|uniref:Flagellin n=1 Tax=Thiogranum longum TaxID=1537524 RepID=A0A4R1HEU8_9GAMM|nr:flagellin [Thiogranum longum]TCK18855.1 flagellin [Thiogranum longum]
MALTINTNIASLNAQRNLSSSQGSLQTSLQRLSSGMRVNSAKDDAAGLFSIQKMTADIRGLNQAVRNAQDGISLAQTGEGAMDQVQSAMQRIREIAVQSSNATVEDRSGLQAEVDQLTQEISRIVDTTEFNGKKLLDGTGGSLVFQIGQDGNADQQITVTGLDLTALTSYDTDLTATGTVDVSSAAAASGAIAGLDSATTGLDFVSGQRATFGAVQNRFESVVVNLTNYSENLSAARSRIQDTDFAMETANLTRAQILQQAGVAMLSQANALPQTALSLLQ